MISFNKIFIFAIFSLSLQFNYLHAMEPVLEHEPLITENGAHDGSIELREVAIAPHIPEPEINIQIPPNTMDEFNPKVITGAGAAMIVIGAAFLYYDHTRVVETVIGSCIEVTGVSCLIGGLIALKRIRNRNNTLHTELVAHATQTIRQQLATTNRRVPSNALAAKVCHLIALDYTEGLKSLISNVNDQSLFTPLQTAQQKKDTLFALMRVFKRKHIRMPKDMIFATIAQCPELIHNRTLFCHTLPLVKAAGLLKDAIQHCPLSWFNTYYHNHCSNEHKVDFANDAARTATHLRMDTILSLVPPSAPLFSPEEKKDVFVKTFNAYHQEITCVSAIE